MGIVLTKLRPCVGVHQFLGPTLDTIVIGEAELTGAIVHERIEECYGRRVVPSATEGNHRALTLHGTPLEHITAIACRTVVGRQGVGATTGCFTFLAVEQVVAEIDTTVTADEIDRTVDLAVLEVLDSTLQVAVVGVLVGQQLHVLAYGLGTLIPEGYGATVVIFVVVERILDGEILEVGAADVLVDLDGCGLVN